jgi:predicted RNA-binding Zn-ribbon protein involved in translation (DUF1610 family)
MAITWDPIIRPVIALLFGGLCLSVVPSIRRDMKQDEMVGASWELTTAAVHRANFFEEHYVRLHLDYSVDGEQFFFSTEQRADRRGTQPKQIRIYYDPQDPRHFRRASSVEDGDERLILVEVLSLGCVSLIISVILFWRYFSPWPSYTNPSQPPRETHSGSGAADPCEPVSAWLCSDHGSGHQSDCAHLARLRARLARRAKRVFRPHRVMQWPIRRRKRYPGHPCPQCGELIPYGFEICRNCDAELRPIQPDG